VLERGVADAITFPWNSTVLFGIDKATKYHMDSALYVTTFVWLLNQSKYDAMSPSQKKVIDDHCNTAWADKIAAPWAEWEAAGRAKIKEEPGHEVYQLTAEQLAQIISGLHSIRLLQSVGERVHAVAHDRREDRFRGGHAHAVTVPARVGFRRSSLRARFSPWPALHRDLPPRSLRTRRLPRCPR